MTSVDRAGLAAELSRVLAPGATGGHVVAVLGPAGIGKTTLIGAVMADLEQVGVRIVADRATRSTVHRPFASIRALTGEADDPVTTAVDTVDRWCAQGPVLIWIDDAQHLDAGSTTVLIRLAHATRDLPLTLILAARDEQSGPEPATLLGLADVQFRVPPLTPTEIHAVAHNRLGSTGADRISDQLAGAQGNPFALQVLLDLASADGQSATFAVGGSHQVAAAAAAAKLRQLPPETTDVLTTLAVIGTPVDPGLLAAVSGVPVIGLHRLLSPAIDAGVLIWTGDELEFAHDSYPETSLVQLPDALRRATHREVARVLAERGSPDAQIAEHALRAGSPEAVQLVRSVAAATAATAPGVAADLLGELEPLAGDTNTDVDADAVVAEQAHALLLAGRVREADDLIRTALPRIRSVAVEAQLRDLALTALVERANIPAIRAEIDNLLARTDLPTEFRRHLLADQAWAVLLGGDLPAAERLVAERIDPIDDGALAPGVRAAAALLHGHPTAAIRIDETVNDPTGDRERQNATPPLLPLYLLYATGPTQARAANNAARTFTASYGARGVQVFHDIMLVNICFDAGDWDDALAALGAAMELATETGTRWTAAPEGVGAYIDIHRGNLDAATRRLNRIERSGLAAQFGLDFPALAALALSEAHAVAALTADPGADWRLVMKPVAARAALLWQSAVTRESELWQARIALDAYRVGDDALQADIATKLDAWPTGDLPGWDPVREAILGLHGQDLRRVLDSAAALDSAANPLAAAMAREEAGLLAAHIGANSTARAALRAAVDGYENLAATTDVSRARTRAHRNGTRPGGPATRRRATSGWSALTPTEATVTQLVRQGRTNPEIAGELYLSPRTVQTHVSNILRKTNLRSRLEIALAAPA